MTKMTKKTQRRLDETLKYAMVIGALLDDGDLLLDNVPLGETVRRRAVDIEVTKMLNSIGISNDQLSKFGKSLDWSTSSPEFIEFSAAVQAGLSQAQADREVM